MCHVSNFMCPVASVTYPVSCLMWHKNFFLLKILIEERKINQEYSDRVIEPVGGISAVYPI